MGRTFGWATRGTLDQGNHRMVAKRSDNADHRPNGQKISQTCGLRTRMAQDRVDWHNEEEDYAQQLVDVSCIWWYTKAMEPLWRSDFKCFHTSVKYCWNWTHKHAWCAAKAWQFQQHPKTIILNMTIELNKQQNNATVTWQRISLNLLIAESPVQRGRTCSSRISIIILVMKRNANIAWSVRQRRVTLMIKSFIYFECFLHRFLLPIFFQNLVLNYLFVTNYCTDL